MDEAFLDSKRVSREILRTLTKKRDGPGLAHLAVQLPLLIGSGLVTINLAAKDNPWWWLTVTVCALALLTFFPALHEASHGTAFKTDKLNRAVAWIGAVLMLQAPSFFRQFHFEHHRRTQNPEHDPEISRAPALLDHWPSNPVTYLILASGQLLLVGKAMFTLSSALLPSAHLWERLFPFIRERERGRVAWESRVVVLMWGGGCVLGLTYVPAFAALLLAWPLSHVMLGLYLMPEHTGLAHDGSQIHRTRTIRSNVVVRWFMWNMPYHTEHHAYPAVPFHAAPELGKLLAPELENSSSGYLAFHVAAIRRAFSPGIR